MTRIAIVGGGMAGLACARALLDAGHAVRLFEKSRGVGGRMATRRTPQGTYDHGAQYFTARDPLFRSVVDDWLASGTVVPYAGRIVQVQSGQTQSLAHPEQRYVAVPAMTAVCRMLAVGMDVESECQISAVTPGDGGWRLSWESGGESGFDAVVLAIPVAQALPLCSAVPQLASRFQGGSHMPCWAVMARYESPLPVAFDAAFIADTTVGWAMRDASRPGRVAGERWVLHATAEWSHGHLEADAETVAPQVVQAFHAATGVEASVAEAKAHRWRYALSRGLQAGAFLDEAHRIGVCGDWCADGRIEGAYLSGAGLAARLLPIL